VQTTREVPVDVLQLAVAPQQEDVLRELQANSKTITFGK
jgi:hypothetical protein